MEQKALIWLAEGSPVLTEFVAFGQAPSRQYSLEALEEVLLKAKGKGYGYAVRHVAANSTDAVLNQAAYCAYEEGGPELYLLLRRIAAENYARLLPYAEGTKAVLREKGFPVERIAACLHRPKGHPQRDYDWEAYKEADRRINTFFFSQGTRTPLFYQGQKRLHQGYAGREELLASLGLRP